MPRVISLPSRPGRDRFLTQRSPTHDLPLPNETGRPSATVTSKPRSATKFHRVKVTSPPERQRSGDKPTQCAILGINWDGCPQVQIDIFRKDDRFGKLRKAWRTLRSLRVGRSSGLKLFPDAFRFDNRIGRGQSLSRFSVQSSRWAAPKRPEPKRTNPRRVIE